MQMNDKNIDPLTPEQIRVYDNLKLLLGFFYQTFREELDLCLDPDKAQLSTPPGRRDSAKTRNEVYFENMLILQACTSEVSTAFMKRYKTCPEYKEVKDKVGTWCQLIIRTGLALDEYGYPKRRNDGTVVGAIQTKENYETFHHAMNVYVAFMFDVMGKAKGKTKQ